MEYVKTTIRELMAAARGARYRKREVAESKERGWFRNYEDGPMAYLGADIVRMMKAAGYPAKVHCLYRSPEDQDRARERGVSKASAWQSPHQFLEAVDIIHATQGWEVSPEFWEALASCVRVCEKKHGVLLTHGHYWKFVDSAHIELTDWRAVRKRQAALVADWEGATYHKPTKAELAARFEQVLPAVWKRHLQRK